MDTITAAFDAQASSFGKRAGLLPEVRQAIARAVVNLGGLEQDRRIVDIGAGTGEIGLELVGLGLSYAGIDASGGMLAAFRERAAALGLSPDLLVADACSRWPIPDASVRVVFGSRSLHWIETSHLVAEVQRVGSSSGAVLLIGRVVRDPDDPREQIRGAMQERLRAAGYEGRSGRDRAGESVAECVRRGARPLPERVVASWTVKRRPSSSIDDWRGKPGLAGRDVPDAVKARVLDEVLAFTTRAFGNIEAPVEVTERYVLGGAEIAFPRRHGAPSR